METAVEGGPDIGPTTRKRIGVLGGTFDPVHIGHLVAAVNARHALDLDVVLLMVANRPWQKVGTREVSPAEDRFAVVQAAVSAVEGIEASRLEIARGGPSYTADTLAELAMAHPSAELFLLVGSDLVGELETWARVEELRRHCTLVVISRPGSAVAISHPGWRLTSLEIPALEVSSTDLRRRVAEGRPLDFLVPAQAIACIHQRGMYAVEE